MREPQRLTALRTSTACYRDSFIYFFCHLLGYNTVYSVQSQPKFRRNMSPQHSTCFQAGILLGLFDREGGCKCSSETSVDFQRVALSPLWNYRWSDCWPVFSAVQCNHSSRSGLNSTVTSCELSNLVTSRPAVVLHLGKLVTVITKLDASRFSSWGVMSWLIYGFMRQAFKLYEVNR
jgi:hypothetical protein